MPLPSQQPPGQEAASQTQLPCAVHSWLAVHVAHAPPFAPQCWAFDPTHSPLEQHPEQLMPPQLHAPAVHVWPVAQVPQTVPFVPHAVVLCWASSTHWSPLQQPPEHEPGVQTQVPLVPQVCPDAQAEQAAPPVPHWPAACAA